VVLGGDDWMAADLARRRMDHVALEEVAGGGRTTSNERSA
jgi:hypothetical protein